MNKWVVALILSALLNLVLTIKLIRARIDLCIETEQVFKNYLKGE